MANEVLKDLDSAGIADLDDEDHSKFCAMVESWTPPPRVPKCRKPLSQERKEKLSAGLKTYWERKSASKKN